ncbi:hypothetical protein FJZ17_02675 [Candidatus Pacearchaeota archaeon]|nr:hypothetical protein [Candidatus Pacearchaeota archaeon]
MNKKKAQVTLFVIIAIVIVVAIIGLFVFRDKLNLNFGRGSSELSSYAESCIESTTLNSLYYVGLQGGYNEVKEPRKSWGPFYLPYLYINPKSLLPSEQIYETQLANNIKNNLQYCEDSIKLAEEKGFSVNIGEVRSVKVDFKEKNILVVVDWPIVFTKNEDSEEVRRIEKQVNFNFLSKYKIIQAFLKEQEQKPGEILLTYLAELGGNNNFKVESQIIQETNDVMYSLVFEKEVYDNRTYVFSFVGKYK